MDRIDLATVIQDAISRFSRNRIGDKPPVFVTLSPALTQVPWQNQTLREFVRFFLYESLLTSDPDAAIEVSLRRRETLDDLNALLGRQPTYWIQLRVSGRGLRMAERAVEELFSEIGFRCEEWLGVENSSARLGIFGAIDMPEVKMVFCIVSLRHILRCDLLLPVVDTCPAPGPLDANDGPAGRSW